MTRVAIVGCGVVGAAIAYELSAIAELEITLLDRNAPASGATRAALGVLMGAISHKTKGKSWRLRRESIQRYETLIPELESLTGQQIPYNRQGILMLRFAGEEVGSWEKLLEKRRSQGWPLEIWDREQLQARCPQVQCERAIGAVYSPRDRQLHPAKLTEALVAAAQIKGVDCKFGVEVQNIIAMLPDDAQIHRCCHIQTKDGVLEIDWLIIAAGLGSTPLVAALQQAGEWGDGEMGRWGERTLNSVQHFPNPKSVRLPFGKLRNRAYDEAKIQQVDCTWRGDLAVPRPQNPKSKSVRFWGKLCTSNSLNR